MIPAETSGSSPRQSNVGTPDNTSSSSSRTEEQLPTTLRPSAANPVSQAEQQVAFPADLPTAGDWIPWSDYWPDHAQQKTLFVWLALILAAWCVQYAVMAWRGGGLTRLEQSPPSVATYLVDINHAAWPEFSALPGVGEKLAKRIVAARDQRGGFDSVDNLLEVDQFGPAKLAAIRPLLTLSPPARPK